MSSRALKRMQQQAAAEGAAVASSESEEGKEEAAVQSVRNAFAGLLDSESDLSLIHI